MQIQCVYFFYFWDLWNSFINASSVFSCSLSCGAVCPLPVLAHILVPLLLPRLLRGALLCNARCIRCIFIPHYFTPHRALLETGDAAIWKKALTLCCVTLWPLLSNFLCRHALINDAWRKWRNTLKLLKCENRCCTEKCKCLQVQEWNSGYDRPQCIATSICTAWKSWPTIHSTISQNTIITCRPASHFMMILFN